MAMSHYVVCECDNKMERLVKTMSYGLSIYVTLCPDANVTNVYVFGLIGTNANANAME